MSNEFESRLKNAIDKAKPLIDAIVADLEREARQIREHDLDPHKLVEERKVQDAKSAGIEALEHLSAFARSLDTLTKQYASDVEQRIDVDAIKEHIAGAPDAARARVVLPHAPDLRERFRASGEDARERLETSAHERRGWVDDARERLEASAHEHRGWADDARERLAATAHEHRSRVDDSAHKSREHLASAAHKGKDDTSEMLAALGWAAAAGGVIYVVFMDEKRRNQAKAVAKATCNGLVAVIGGLGSRH